MDRNQLLQHRREAIVWRWNQVTVKQQLDHTRLVKVLCKDAADNRFMWVQGGTDQILGRKLHHRFGKQFPHVQETVWAENTKQVGKHYGEVSYTLAQCLLFPVYAPTGTAGNKSLGTLKLTVLSVTEQKFVQLHCFLVPQPLFPLLFCRTETNNALVSVHPHRHQDQVRLKTVLNQGLTTHDNTAFLQ